MPDLYNYLSRKLSDTLRRSSDKDKEELIVLYDYKSNRRFRSVELDCKENDALILRSNKNLNWWFAKNTRTGEKGFVPVNFLAGAWQRENLPWYSLSKSRAQCETVLKDAQYEIGTFIIRQKSTQESGSQGTDTSIDQALSLSVKAPDGDGCKILHYKITVADRKFHLGTSVFESIGALITNSSIPERGGLEQPLTYSYELKASVKRWDVKENDIEKETDPVGKGYFGEVYRGKLFGHTDVAIKTMFADKMKPEQFMKEAERGRTLFHENIVKTLAICSEANYIITEFVVNGSLKKYLISAKKLSAKKLSAQDKVIVSMKIASAMIYLGKRGLIHRDLAARNILVGETIHDIKLADFGLSREISDEYYRPQSAYSAQEFPIKHSPPEAFPIKVSQDELKSGKFSTASDVWSYGVVLWEIYTDGHREPYGAILNSRLKKLLENGHRLDYPNECPKAVYNKMRECWNITPKKRPTFEDLHEFFKNYSNII